MTAKRSVTFSSWRAEASAGLQVLTASLRFGHLSPGACDCANVNYSRAIRAPRIPFAPAASASDTSPEGLPLRSTRGAPATIDTRYLPVFVWTRSALSNSSSDISCWPARMSRSIPILRGFGSTALNAAGHLADSSWKSSVGDFRCFAVGIFLTGAGVLQIVPSKNTAWQSRACQDSEAPGQCLAAENLRLPVGDGFVRAIRKLRPAAAPVFQVQTRLRWSQSRPSPRPSGDALQPP